MRLANYLIAHKDHKGNDLTPDNFTVVHIFDDIDSFFSVALC
jgi:hypothetical protein